MSAGIHPDFLKYGKIKPPLNARALPFINFILTKALNKTSVGSGLTEERLSIEVGDGAKISLSLISPAECNSALPALVYFHGGAFAMQASPHHKRLVAEYALKTPCKVAFVDYRLLPKATYPIGLKECFSAYKWITENTSSLGVIPERIAVGGDSAGGALSIGVCKLSLEQNVRMPCFQMLIYPVTDIRQNTPSMREFTDTPLWNSKLNAKMWKMYLEGVPPEKWKDASPVAAHSFAGFPPTFVEVAEFDCLRDEGREFAKTLQANGVAAELRQTYGTIHGFEIAENNEIVRDSIAQRIDRLKKALQPEV